MLTIAQNQWYGTTLHYLTFSGQKVAVQGHGAMTYSANGTLRAEVWLGDVAVGRRIRDREVVSSIPGCSAARCNSGQVVHIRASVHQAV